MSESPPEYQRALIFQGQGSLAAYEAAVFGQLYKKLKEEDKQVYKGERAPFDIVAGTSMGGINAAIVVSYVIENGTWEGTVEKLDDFWQHITGYSIADTVVPALEKIPGYNEWLDFWRKINPKLASAEEARKHYSGKESLTIGLRNVYSAPVPVIDTKFFDPQNVWYRYDNEPLKNSVKQFVKFPISTDFEKDQPRLLLLAVDVEEGEKVTFDSFLKQSKYAYDVRSKEYRHILNYDNGLMLEHVMASASIPIHFDYTWVPKQYDYSTEAKEYSGRKNSRPFWEGSILSNTPIREVISHYKTFWENQIGSEKLYDSFFMKDSRRRIPNLDLYVVNTWYAKTKEIPLDRDGMIARRENIIFHDKTADDEKLALLLTDYIELLNKIKNISINYIDETKKDAYEADIKRFLNSQAMSKFRTGERRKYRDLITRQFEIGRVVRIEIQDD